ANVDRQHESGPLVGEKLDEDIANAVCALGVDDTAGFLVASKMGPHGWLRETELFKGIPTAASILHGAVARDKRRRGLGRLLFQGMFKMAGAAGYTRVGSVVRLGSNENFHRALGFEELGRTQVRGPHGGHFVYMGRLLA